MPKQSNYKPLSPIAIDYAQDLSVFGRNVRKYREQQELTLDDLAALLNSDKAAVSRIENGERKDHCSSGTCLPENVSCYPCNQPIPYADEYPVY